MLLKCFFPYTKEGIIELINSELCCDFSHILISGDTDIDIDNNTALRIYIREVIAMIKLKSEYTDIKNVTHTVQHTVLHKKDTALRERILEDLLIALTKAHK